MGGVEGGWLPSAVALSRRREMCRRRNIMRLISWLIMGMAPGLIGLVSPYATAAEQISKPLPSAQLVEVEGASSTYRLIDRDGRVVTAVVPSQSIGDIQQNSPDNT